MTDQPTGRALAEAAARAMGWTWKPDDSGSEGCVYDEHGKYRGFTAGPSCYECGGSELGWPAEREMLAHLTRNGSVEASIRECSTVVEFYRSTKLEGGESLHYEAEACGPTLRDALMRLVVAVKEREAKA